MREHRLIIVKSNQAMMESKLIRAFASWKMEVNLFQVWLDSEYFIEGYEGVKWELVFAIFRGWEMGFCALGLGFMKQKQ